MNKENRHYGYRLQFLYSLLTKDEIKALKSYMKKHLNKESYQAMEYVISIARSRACCKQRDSDLIKEVIPNNSQPTVLIHRLFNNSLHFLVSRLLKRTAPYQWLFEILKFQYLQLKGISQYGQQDLNIEYITRKIESTGHPALMAYLAWTQFVTELQLSHLDIKLINRSFHLWRKANDLYIKMLNFTLANRLILMFSKHNFIKHDLSNISSPAIKKLINKLIKMPIKDVPKTSLTYFVLLEHKFDVMFYLLGHIKKSETLLMELLENSKSLINKNNPYTYLAALLRQFRFSIINMDIERAKRSFHEFRKLISNHEVSAKWQYYYDFRKPYLFQIEGKIEQSERLLSKLLKQINNDQVDINDRLEAIYIKASNAILLKRKRRLHNAISALSSIDPDLYYYTDKFNQVAIEMVLYASEQSLYRKKRLFYVCKDNDELLDFIKTYTHVIKLINTNKPTNVKKYYYLDLLESVAQHLKVLPGLIHLLTPLNIPGWLFSLSSPAREAEVRGRMFLTQHLN